MKQEHIEFFFTQITTLPADKMSSDEFGCLSELGKYSLDVDFKNKVVSFFWSVVCQSDSYKDDIVTSCISKFAEMVKYWDIK